MHEFRKQIGRGQRQAVDGFLNAPQRSNVPQEPLGRRGLSADRFRSANPRRLDDFKRAEGYHPVTRPISQAEQIMSQRSNAPARRSQASILHMTLPGGALEHENKKRLKSKSRGKDHSKPQSKWHTVRRWGLRTGLVVVALVILLSGFLFTKGFFKLHKVFRGGGTAAALQSNVKPELLKGEGDGRINILLLGKGGGNHDGPDLTDTLLVLSIDPVNKTASMVSVPRDLWVTDPGYGSTKINAVYANHKYHALSVNPKDKNGAEQAGISAIEKQVTTVFGIPIHYYGMIDFAAFQQAVNTVGGVDINVPSTATVLDYMYNEDTHRPYTLNVQAGMQHFDGLRALMYARSRHASARGDFDRTERQRLLIEALSEKILSAGTYTNPFKISQLMSAFGDHISTDFSVNDALRLMQIAKGIGTSNIKSIGLADPPNNYVVTDWANNQSVVRPTAGFGDYSQIQSYIRNVLIDPYISKENAAIEILNGTTVPGLAGGKSDELKSYGYNVIKVDTAPTSDYQKTVLVDMTGGKKPYTKNYLQKRLGVTAASKLPDPNISATGADFVIILGQDATANSQN